MYTNPGEWQWTSAHHGQAFVWWHSAWLGCEGCCPAGERHHKCWHWWCWTLMNQFVHNCMTGWIVDIWLGSTARGKKNCFEAYGLALTVVVMLTGYNNHGGGANSDSCSPVVCEFWQGFSQEIMDDLMFLCQTTFGQPKAQLCQHHKSILVRSGIPKLLIPFGDRVISKRPQHL